MTIKDIIKVTINLMLIYLGGGLLLGFVYSKTSPIIFKKNVEEKKAALRKMMPEADEPKKLGDWEPHHKHSEYYAAYKDGEVIGYIVESYGKGYSSYIHLLAAMDMDFKVQKIDVLSHAETPGLGDEIEKEEFKNRYVGKAVDQLEVVKSDTTDKIAAITGATISTRAVTVGVRDGVEMMMEKAKDGPPPPLQEKKSSSEEGGENREDKSDGH